jgi:hypothetical protein
MMSDKYTQNLIAAGADPVLVSKYQQVPAPKAVAEPAQATEEPAKPRKAAKRTRKAE